MPSLRPYRPKDLDALYAICLATGDSGADASHLYDDPKLIGHIYAAPYGVLAPERVFVAEDEAGVGGYVCGAWDTAEWAARLEREWWPDLREQYPDTRTIPTGQRSADQQRIAMIHAPEIPPAPVLDRFPAHMHMNLLPRLQGKGLGTALLRAWLDDARVNGVTAVHVGVSRVNAGGAAFWSKSGFTEIELPGSVRSLWMGRSV